MKVYVFPGQGSQKQGMGADLFDRAREFLDAEEEINKILGYSLRDLCLEDTENLLQQTQYTQPALYIVNALYYFDHNSRTGQVPDYTAGHSLGEYNALMTAGVFDLVTGLRLVRERGALMARVKNGGMAAIVGLDAKRIDKLIQDNELTGLDIANYNSPLQTVISGPVSDIEMAKPVMEQAGARLYKTLHVSAAFHSRYMAETSKAFAKFLNVFEFKSPEIPVIANVTGKPYPEESSSDSIKSLLVQQIASPVRWTESIRFLLNQGATNFEELGPGKVLARLIQQIQNES